ncbi:membrane-spanning 4-domains subfamily A member 4A-like isoform X1 [Petaurus breviceps papuanus]|uniref:membrane-spanning 4-domains subfamily A member 4A-like isoform X1 n=1 Tax=Petaurus breviceps papuanus TaxID=3040969 RepID=UPI0036DDE5B0
MESQSTTNGMFTSFPQTGPTSIPQGAMVQSYQWKVPLQKFLKGEPKALGTAQIMIALMNLSLGMIFAFLPPSGYGQNYFLWSTGYIFWGSAFFIISGSLSIAAENRTTSALVQSSMAMNIVSSVVAGLGIVFYSINLIFLFDSFYFCHRNCSYGSCCSAETIAMGSNVFLLILNILQVTISLTVSGFACKPFCCTQSGIAIFIPPPTCVPEDSAAKVCEGGTTLQSPAADTTALPGSHPDSFI